MVVFTLCDKEEVFIGFLRAEDKEQCWEKISQLPFPCKIYKQPFVSKRCWYGKQRTLKFVRGENGR
jgi:hypothetical protein